MRHPTPRRGPELQLLPRVEKFQPNTWMTRSPVPMSMPFDRHHHPRTREMTPEFHTPSLTLPDREHLQRCHTPLTHRAPKTFHETGKARSAEPPQWTPPRPSPVHNPTHPPHASENRNRIEFRDFRPVYRTQPPTNNLQQEYDPHPCRILSLRAGSEKCSYPKYHERQYRSERYEYGAMAAEPVPKSRQRPEPHLRIPVNEVTE